MESSCNDTTCRKQYHTDIIRNVLCQKVLFRRIVQSFDRYEYRKAYLGENLLDNTKSYLQWRFSFDQVFNVDWILRNNHFGLFLDKVRLQPATLFYSTDISSAVLGRMKHPGFTLAVFIHLFKAYRHLVRFSGVTGLGKVLSYAIKLHRNDIFDYIIKNISIDVLQDLQYPILNWAVFSNNLHVTRFCFANFDLKYNDKSLFSVSTNPTLEMVSLFLNVDVGIEMDRYQLLIDYIGERKYLTALIRMGDLPFYSDYIEQLDPQVTINFNAAHLEDALHFLIDDFNVKVTRSHLELVKFIFKDEPSLGLLFDEETMLPMPGIKNVPDEVKYRIYIYLAKTEVFDKHMATTRHRKLVERNNQILAPKYFKHLSIFNNKLLDKDLAAYLLRYDIHSLYRNGSIEQIELANSSEVQSIVGTAQQKLNIIFLSSNHTVELLETIKKYHDLARLRFLVKDIEDFNGSGITYLVKQNIKPKTPNNEDISTELYSRHLFATAYGINPEYRLKTSSYDIIVKCALPSLDLLEYIHEINPKFVNLRFRGVDKHTTLDALRFYLDHREKDAMFYQFVKIAALEAIAIGRMDIVECLEVYNPMLLTTNSEPLEIAIIHGYYNSAEEICKKLTPATKVRHQLIFMLHLELDFLKFYIGYRYDSVKDKLGSILHRAKAERRMSVVQYLLELHPNLQTAYTFALE